MRVEVKINIFCIFLFFISMIATAYFVQFNKRMGGNILNDGSEIVNEEYYIVDNFGNKTQITQTDWEKCKVVTVFFFVIVTLGSLAIFYLFCRYIFIPSVIENFHSIIKVLGNMKRKRN